MEEKLSASEEPSVKPETGVKSIGAPKGDPNLSKGITPRSVTAEDSLRRSEVFTEHGQTTHFDSIGAGNAQNWTDTAFVGGKLKWWRKVYDGDGDGFVVTAAAGGKAKIRSDNFSDLGDGTFWYGFETHGPGPDGDYGKDADNERYAASAMTVNSKGEDVNKSLSGDADGDGLLWSAAAGAANRVWETSAWYRRGDLKSYKDSVVKVLGVGAGREAGARVVFYGAASERLDGTRTAIGVSSLDGKTPFGPADTVLVTERVTYPAGDAERRDSTLRSAHLVPGRLDREDDDLVVWWSAKVHYNAATALSLKSETFASAKPIAPGAEAEAGSRVTEERYRGSRPRDLVRLWKRHDFEKAAGTSAWKEIRTYKDGDSSVASGNTLSKDGGTFVNHTGKGLKSSGWYDAATGAFKDTVTWVDAQGAAMGTRKGAGSLKGGAGGYAVTITRADGKSTEIRITAVKAADGSRLLTRVSGKDTVVCTVRGDTTTQEKSFGKVGVRFTLTSLGAGSYKVALSGKDLGGAPLISGGMDFGPEGTGSGELLEYARGVAKPAVSFRSDADGTVYLGGEKLP